LLVAYRTGHTAGRVLYSRDIPKNQQAAARAYRGLMLAAKKARLQQQQQQQQQSPRQRVPPSTATAAGSNELRHLRLPLGTCGNGAGALGAAGGGSSYCPSPSAAGTSARPTASSSGTATVLSDR